MRKIGADLSHWNKITDWEKLDSLDFIIHKCTQGEYYVDPTYENNKAEIRKLSRPIFGAYHFANGGDAIKEANHFLKNLGEFKNDILVLDWEINHSNPPVWCRKFLDYVKEKTGKTPYLYTNENRILSMSWKECIDFPLWVAKYNLNDGQMGTPPKTGDWKEYKIWQFTSRGSVPGIEGNVDLNYAPQDLVESPVSSPEPQGEVLTPEDTIMFKPGKFIKLSQRDPKWNFKTIGETKMTIGAWGCTLTCVSMASSWFDCYKDPAWMAKNLRYTGTGLLYWQSIDEKTCFDFEWRFYKHDEKRIKEALDNPRKVCLLQVYSRHWILATRKVPLGYIAVDPWTGGYKYYLTSSISGGCVLKI
jgi:GH25 family lysozyme M1 (1,4-beta-N-acetylmuramidase)